jgi:hypothetical protein
VWQRVPAVPSHKLRHNFIRQVPRSLTQLIDCYGDTYRYTNAACSSLKKHTLTRSSTAQVRTCSPCFSNSALNLYLVIIRCNVLSLMRTRREENLAPTFGAACAVLSGSSDAAIGIATYKLTLIDSPSLRCGVHYRETRVFTTRSHGLQSNVFLYYRKPGLRADLRKSRDRYRMLCDALRCCAVLA